MSGGRVAVVGGSIAGCAAALAAHRAGADQVVVFERTSGRLADRGVGVAVSNPLYAELREAGYLGAAVPCVELADRRWITWDGTSYGGRVIATQKFGFRAYNWGSLWRALRDDIPPDVAYRIGCPVVSVADTPDGGVVTLADGTVERFEIVLGADGYRSVVREAMFPGIRPRYAGYLAWRGTLPAADVPARDGLWDVRDAMTVCFPGGHLMAYLIPGRLDELALNWALYAVPPAEPALRLTDPTSLPPGAVAVELVDHLAVLGARMPPYWREMLARMPPQLLQAQPIYDLQVPACAAGHLALVGDAGAVARPHTGGGVAKAMQDAATLESVLGGQTDWPAALRVYDARRGRVRGVLVGLGRALGEATVLHAPDWSRLDAAGFDAWWASVATEGGLGGSA